MRYVNDLLLLCGVLGVAYLSVANVVVWRFGRSSTARAAHGLHEMTRHGEPPVTAQHAAAGMAQHAAPETQQPLTPAGSGAPSISILKPVFGAEPQLYENLASFCAQEYPDYEVLFCLHNERDAAKPVVERVASDYPAASPRVLVGDDAVHRNPKVANLAKGLRAARGRVVVISDSDVRVGPDYLRAVATAFARERTGALSSLYRGIAASNSIGELGAAYAEEQFAPSVLVAALGRVRFCLGASMAVRRTALDAIGGIDALGPYLADDHKLGELVAERGYDVELTPYVVATTIPETKVRDLWAHELRWARTNRVLAPLGYAFSFLMFGVPLALLYVLISQNWIIGLPLLATAATLRVALHFNARRVLGVSGRRSGSLRLIPLRDALSVAIWVASFFGRSVRWRRSETTIAADGRMQ